MSEPSREQIIAACRRLLDGGGNAMLWGDSEDAARGESPAQTPRALPADWEATQRRVRQTRRELTRAWERLDLVETQVARMAREAGVTLPEEPQPVQSERVRIEVWRALRPWIGWAFCLGMLLEIIRVLLGGGR